MLWGWNRKLPGSQSEHLNNRAQGVPWSRERLARGPGPPLPCDLAHQPSPQTGDLSVLCMWDEWHDLGNANPITAQGCLLQAVIHWTIYSKHGWFLRSRWGLIRVTSWEARTSVPASTPFICGFGLLKTNDMEAVLWASNELFIHSIKLFYWRTRTCLTLESSAWCVGILLNSNHFPNFALGTTLKIHALGLRGKEISILKAL